MKAAPSAIGRYQILSELGQGGMGVVYLAQDPTLKRKVAIKCMIDPKGEHNALERFHREAETSSRLNHPNVITVYDVGEDPHIGPFLAMEFVEGSSFADLISQNALTRETSFQVLTQVMYALLAAHEAGIIHRDVKPANLLVGKEGRVKLMDFGIALGEGARLTAVGDVLGSPSYTAPERLQGKDANPGTDLYAFVVTAFEAMTGGCLPFKGNTLGATMFQIVHEPPTLPPDLEPQLAALFRKALDKDPDHRFASLGHFMTALARCLHLPAPVMPILGAMPSHGEHSGIAPTHSSHGEGKVSGGSAPQSQAPTKSTSPSGEMGRHLAAPPQDLLKHKQSGDQTPKAAPVRPLPLPVRARPAPRPVAPAKGKLSGLLIAVAAIMGLLVAGSWGWRFYSTHREHSVKVESVPPFAHVFVDGVDLGTTPCTLSLKVKAARMQLSRSDYEPLTLDLSEDTTAISPSLKLQSGYFRVITEPRDAQVFLNGQYLETSPIWSWKYQGKAMTLRVEKTGYEKVEIKFSPDKPLPEPLTLKRKL